MMTSSIAPLVPLQHRSIATMRSDLAARGVNVIDATTPSDPKRATLAGAAIVDAISYLSTADDPVAPLREIRIGDLQPSSKGQGSTPLNGTTVASAGLTVTSRATPEQIAAGDSGSVISATSYVHASRALARDVEGGVEMLRMTSNLAEMPAAYRDSFLLANKNVVHEALHTLQDPQAAIDTRSSSADLAQEAIVDLAAQLETPGYLKHAYGVDVAPAAIADAARAGSAYQPAVQRLERVIELAGIEPHHASGYVMYLARELTSEQQNADIASKLSRGLTTDPAHVEELAQLVRPWIARGVGALLQRLDQLSDVAQAQPSRLR